MNRPWLFLLSIFVFCFFIAACASPYHSQAKALQEAYQNGNISTSDYHARMNELQALDLQWRQNQQQSLNQFNAQMQRQQQQRQANQQQVYNSWNQQQNQQQMINQMNRPRNTSGTIYTPSGNMYRYDETTY